MASITQLRLFNRYQYKNSCIPPAYACCQISGPIVAQLVGKCHCLPQRLEEGCHTLYRSLFVWLILTGPIHHCWACWLSLQHDHSKRSNFSTGGMLIRLALSPLAHCHFLFMCPSCFLFFYLALSHCSGSSLLVFL